MYLLRTSDDSACWAHPLRMPSEAVFLRHLLTSVFEAPRSWLQMSAEVVHFKMAWGGVHDSSLFLMSSLRYVYRNFVAKTCKHSSCGSCPNTSTLFELRWLNKSKLLTAHLVPYQVNLPPFPRSAVRCVQLCSFPTLLANLCCCRVVLEGLSNNEGTVTCSALYAFCVWQLMTFHLGKNGQLRNF